MLVTIGQYLRKDRNELLPDNNNKRRINWKRVARIVATGATVIKLLLLIGEGLRHFL